MAYSPPVMILIFIKPHTDSLVTYWSRRAQKALRVDEIRTDLERLGFRRCVTEATYLADTCISTLNLCDANFAEVSLGNTMSEGELRRGNR
jgi:hypothetical protein